MGIFDGVEKAVSGLWNHYVDPENHYNDPGYKADPNAYQYGGHAGGADAATQRYQDWGANYYNKQGAQVDNTNYAAALGKQKDVYGAYADAMNGVGPSVAELQRQHGVQDAMNAQASIAASARGGGANLAAAQRMAAQQAGNQMAGSNSQAAMLRAQEIEAARAGAAGLANTMAGQGAQNAQYQAGLQQQQNQINAQTQLGFEGLGANVQAQQLQAQMQGQQDASSAYSDAQHINSGVAGGNTATRQHILGAAASAAGGSMGSALTGQPGQDAGAPSPAFKSDALSKIDIEPASMRDAMSHLKPLEYSYANPDEDGYGRRVGVMAQDLEKSPQGASAVRDTPRGKMVDEGAATSFALAGLADINKRLRALEGGRK